MSSSIIALALLLAFPFLFPNEFTRWSRSVRRSIEERELHRASEATNTAQEADTLLHHLQQRLDDHNNELQELQHALQGLGQSEYEQ